MAHTPRLFVGGHPGPGMLHLDGEQSRRLSGVMRLREGDDFLVFAGDGREWRATVRAVTKSGIEATIGEITRQEALAPLTVEVWCALVRPNRFDWAIEKCVEAGASVIRPLLSEFTARGEGSSAARRDRWMRIAIEAAEQSGRLFVPPVQAPERFEALLGQARRTPIVIAHRDGRGWASLEPLLPVSGSLALVVGPEGGFSEEELRTASAQGALLASLGPNILRTETAAVVAVALARANG